jgi:hypothetical protein
VKGTVKGIFGRDTDFLKAEEGERDYEALREYVVALGVASKEWVEDSKMRVDEWAA